MNIVAVDTETTGLEDQHEPYEVALIDFEGNEFHWWLPVDLGKADARALEIGKFYERYPWTSSLVTPLAQFAKEFSTLTHGKHLVGACPWFDAGMLEKVLRRNGACPGWHHRLICVENLAAGWLKRLPNGLGNSAEELFIPVDSTSKHTALGDAKTAMEIFKVIMECESE